MSDVAETEAGALDVGVELNGTSEAPVNWRVEAVERQRRKVAKYEGLLAQARQGLVEAEAELAEVEA